MNLLSLKFWFALDPAPLRAISFNIFLVVFLVLAVVGILGRVIAARNKKNYFIRTILLKLGRPFISTGIVGLMLLFFEYERILFLSSRFWYALLLVWFLYSFSRFLNHVMKKLPFEIKELEKKSKVSKYLPH